MDKRTHTLRLLRREPPDALAAITAMALPHAEPGERNALFALAIRAGRPESLAAAIAVAHQVRGAVEELAGPDVPLTRALALAMSRGDQATLNAIAVIRRRGETNLLEHLVPSIGNVDNQVAREAAAALLHIVEQRVGSEGRQVVSNDDASRLDAAIFAAAATGRRELDDIWLAAALLARHPGPRLASLLADPEHPLAFALRRIVGRTDHRLVRGNLFRWLMNPALGGQVLRRLHLLKTTSEFDETLRHGHLLVLPAARRGLRRADRPAACLPAHDVIASLPPAAQPSLVRYLKMVPATAALRRDRLSHCAVTGSDAGRLLAVLALLGESSGDLADHLEKAALDRREPVAELAARPLLGGVGEASHLRRLAASPHPAIARGARAALAAGGVKPFFEHLERLRPVERIMAARRLIAGHPQAMLKAMRAALRSGDRTRQLVTMALARRLGVVGGLMAPLTALCRDPDVHVASNAVATLGDALPANARSPVRVALGHGDPRVEANAIEALMRLDPAATDHLRDRFANRDNRLRGNAIRAMLRRRGGTDLLRAMLHDGEARHRVSAVWVARRERVAPVIADLEDLAAGDAIVEVRSRAAAALSWVRACPMLVLSPSILNPPGSPLEYVPGRIAAGAVMAGTALAIMAFAGVSLRRVDRRRLGPSTRRLCRSLRVYRGDRMLLARMAAHVGAPGAAPVLVSRGCFDAAAGRFGSSARERRRIEALRERLFE